MQPPSSNIVRILDSIQLQHKTRLLLIAYRRAVDGLSLFYRYFDLDSDKILYLIPLY